MCCLRGNMPACLSYLEFQQGAYRILTSATHACFDTPSRWCCVGSPTFCVIALPWRQTQGWQASATTSRLSGLAKLNPCVFHGSGSKQHVVHVYPTPSRSRVIHNQRTFVLLHQNHMLGTSMPCHLGGVALLIPTLVIVLRRAIDIPTVF